MLSLTRWCSRVAVWCGGAMIVLAALLVGVEVVIRKVFDLTIGGADELSGFALGISTAWALAFTLLERAHIRIDTLYVRLPVRMAALVDILGLALFLGFIALVAWHGFGVFATSLRLGARSLSPLGTPLVIPQALWVMGLVLFVAVASLLLVRALAALTTGDLRIIGQLIGSRTVEEEVVAELGDQAAKPKRSAA